MRLADFIDTNTEAILSEWENFARTLLPASAGMDVGALRDHAAQILHDIALDLRTYQSGAEQVAKSRGEAVRPRNDPDTAAETHGLLRATSGFTLKQLVAEYRALRATVLKLWAEAHEPGRDSLQDMTRFNEGIDQAIAESVDFYAVETERWRNVFLGVLGHDLRGPLNAILLTSQVISRMNDGSPVGELATRLINGGERMKHLLDDLLDYSRTSLALGIPVTPADTDLRQAFEDELDLQRSAWPKNPIELVVEGSVHGKWDALRLRQALGNLVSNAAKYGDSDAPITVRIVGAADAVTFTVENRGPTLSSAGRDALFEPFRRDAHSVGEKERTSLGLGLYIVRQIAQAHGGSVDVVSGNGQTTFRVSLPRVSAV